jgi:prevent-host-death family protein
MPITISSREANQDLAKAKRAAKEGPVIITDRGKPAHVLLAYEDYKRILHKGGNIIEMLSMPEGADICEDFDSLIQRPAEYPQAVDLS